MKHILFSLVVVLLLNLTNYSYCQTTFTRNYFLQNDTSQYKLFPVHSSVNDNKIIFSLNSDRLQTIRTGFDAIDTITEKSTIFFAKTFENSLLWKAKFSLNNQNDVIDFHTVNISDKLSMFIIDNDNENIVYLNNVPINNPNERLIFLFLDSLGNRVPIDIKIVMNAIPIRAFQITSSNLNNNHTFAMLFRKSGILRIQNNRSYVDDGLTIATIKIDTENNQAKLLQCKTIAKFNSSSMFHLYENPFELKINDNNYVSYIVSKLDSDLDFLTIEPQKIISADTNNIFLFDSTLNLKCRIEADKKKWMLFEEDYPKLGNNNHIYLRRVVNENIGNTTFHKYYLQVYNEQGVLQLDDFLTKRNQFDLTSFQFNLDDSNNCLMSFYDSKNHDENNMQLNIVKLNSNLNRSQFKSTEFSGNRYLPFTLINSSNNNVEILYSCNDTLFDFEQGLIKDSLNRKGVALASIELFPDVTSINEENPKNPKQFKVTISDNGNSVRVSPIENVKYSVSIYTLNGQLLHSLSNVTGEQFIDIEKYTSGMYILKANTATQTNSFSFIKQR